MQALKVPAVHTNHNRCCRQSLCPTLYSWCGRKICFVTDATVALFRYVFRINKEVKRVLPSRQENSDVARLESLIKEATTESDEQCDVPTLSALLASTGPRMQTLHEGTRNLIAAREGGVALMIRNGLPQFFGVDAARLRGSLGTRSVAAPH